MVDRLPIVYVRGYAGSPSGIDRQVDDPFYGFNDGATHVRTDGGGVPRFYQFESPLLRLMTDEGYRLLVHGDQRGYLDSQPDGSVPLASIWVHRFYDYAASTFGTSITSRPERFDLETAAERLYELIQLVRRKTGAPKVHLVAHSMGGLLARCMIQKVSLEVDPRTSRPREPAHQLVDKLVTLGTPHAGISFDLGGGLLDWAMETFGPYGADIFAPDQMYGYLTPGATREDTPPEGWRPNEIPAEAFDVQRVFCVIGTDAADYGLVEKAVGPRSDGLVQIDNAYVRHAHRAFVHRAHSGRYGLVNSEEGYQNLVRFLFGDMRVDGALEVDALPLPASVQKAKDDGKQVRASYYFEATVAPRGTNSYRLTERRCDTFSAVLRSFDELLRPNNVGRDAPRSPVLFSAFLDTSKITSGNTVVFSVELTVSTTGYTIDNKLWLDKHVEGEYLFRDTVVVRATRSGDGWNVRYVLADEQSSEGLGTLVESRPEGYLIPLSSQKGFKGRLRLTVQRPAPAGG